MRTVFGSCTGPDAREVDALLLILNVRVLCYLSFILIQGFKGNQSVLFKYLLVDPVRCDHELQLYLTVRLIRNKGYR